LIGGGQCARKFRSWRCKQNYQQLICQEFWSWHTARKMVARTTLPDLDALDFDALKALIVAQHEQLVSKD